MLGGVKWRCEVDGGCGKKDQEQEKRESGGFLGVKSFTWVF